MGSQFSFFIRWYRTRVCFGKNKLSICNPDLVFLPLPTLDDIEMKSACTARGGKISSPRFPGEHSFPLTADRFRLMTFILVFAALFLVSNPLLAISSQTERLHFKHLGIQNGLSSNIINQIVEDSYGFIWIATPNGLNRFDGSKVITFYFNPADTGSIPSNNVPTLAIDRAGNLWVGTKEGLCRFNYGTEKFERHLQYGPEERNYISMLYVDKMDLLWVGTEHGLFVYNKRTNVFSRMFTDNTMNFFAPLSYAEFGNGTLLVGTWEKGFYHFSKDRRTQTRQTIPLISGAFGAAIPASAEIGINTINSMLIDKNNTVWMATRYGVIKARETTEFGISKYNYSFFTGISAPGINVAVNTHSLCEDNNGYMWIGTEQGLYIYNPATQSNTYYSNDPSDPNSISNNDIRYIFKDRNGNIWIGTYQGGVNIYSPNQKRFQDYFPALNNSSNQKTRYVKSIYQDRKGFIWIGTDMGLYKFSERGEMLKSYTYKANDPTTINIGGVAAIYQDREGRLWVGTWGGGMHLLNTETGAIKRLPWIEEVHDNPLTQGDLNARSIAEDSKGNLWIGNMRGILDKYNPKTGVFEHFKIKLSNMNINAIIRVVLVDKEDNVWMGTEGSGLIKLDTKTKKLFRYGTISNTNHESNTSLNSLDAYSLYFSPDNKLWIGTSNGVNVLDLKTQKFKYYTVKDGLTSNIVYSILPDDAGNIWFSTLNSISMFNMNRKVFINYDNRDGIRVNSEAGFKSPTGWLFFGGVNGINAINPSSIKENFVIPPIVFTDLKILNKSVAVARGSVLEKSINLIDEIELPYNQNIFSLEFAAINYVNTEKNQYACKLEGFDKDWVQLGSVNEARYTNLNPGKYTFRVIASNNDGIWNESGRTLRITILPPWWKTLWFRLLTILAVFLIIVSWILVRTIRLRQQQKQLKKLVIERTEEIEAQKIKLQDQTNILINTNLQLVERQNEVLTQKEAIARQNEKLEIKNLLLEEQKNQISEQRIKEQQMAEKLHEADQMKLRFFTNISHEFRTPLTLILGPLEKLLSGVGNRNPEIHDLGRVIQRNTMRLLNLINQFLDLSKLEAGVVSLNISKGDIFQYIKGIVNAYQFAADQKNISFRFTSETETLTCYFDPDKIEKILYNLLSNAFKFTDINGKIEVDVKLISFENNNSQEPGSIQITVSDSGKGIPADQLDKIFQRFYQVGQLNSEKTTGTGIGLALTHELVTIYRGNISVESTPGIGTTFTVQLPISQGSFKTEEFSQELPDVDQKKHQLIALEDFGMQQDDEEEDDLNEDESPDHNDNKKQATILVVDDNRDIRHFLRDHLGIEYRIIVARDGVEGLKKALKYMPALVISDVMMPKMDGFELCAKLKTDMQTCHIPVIILTAKASTDDELEGIETGADAYIAKPFDIRKLEGHVRRLIAGREQLKQLFKREITVGPSDIVVESSDEKLLNRIIKVMNDNISNPDFGVEELGREVGLSRTHLYRKLKQLTNLTAIEFVRNMRLQRAGQLFRQHKRYVAEVVYMSGFKEMSYFRKIFKEFYGMSPQEYISNANKQEPIQ